MLNCMKDFMSEMVNQLATDDVLEEMGEKLVGAIDKAQDKVDSRIIEAEHTIELAQKGVDNQVEILNKTVARLQDGLKDVRQEFADLRKKVESMDASRKQEHAELMHILQRIEGGTHERSHPREVIDLT